MANNRMYLVCTRCAAEIPKPASDYKEWYKARFYLAKYFPSGGWYRLDDGSTMFCELLEWLDKHSHREGESVIEHFPMYKGLCDPDEKLGTMFGNENIRLEYEIEPD